MYRIAVIQNEVEMQHSGYVDSVPEYQKQQFALNEHSFTRFSSANIRELFTDGTNYLLDYDCLVLGTNATSDDDVYNVLLEDKSKSVLEAFITQGGGLLVCSQKKLKSDDEVEIGPNTRKTSFMPEYYEYHVYARPSDEGSRDKGVYIASSPHAEAPEFLVSYPAKIDNEKIDARCRRNDFQVHYYRDCIKPINDAAYQSVLIGNSEGTRNVLMVATPRNNERIVITTMALDWAGHYDLLENIFYYLAIGIPTLAFVEKGQPGPNTALGHLAAEANLSKQPFSIYGSIDDLLQSQLFKYHLVYVFSQDYSDNDVCYFWKDHAKNNNKSSVLLHYRITNGETSLESYTNFDPLDLQKSEVSTWLKSKNEDGYWDNSFWKTYDALLCLAETDPMRLSPYFMGAFDRINDHYVDGSYDGVLAPTCGLLELESMVLSNEGLKEAVANCEELRECTINWLIDKYASTSTYNRKSILQAFNNANLIPVLRERITHGEVSQFQDEVYKLALGFEGEVADRSEVDLWLDASTCIIYSELYGQGDRSVSNRLRECVGTILGRQLENGRWGNNLGSTARNLAFLLINENIIKHFVDAKVLSSAIESGVLSLRNAYSNGCWGNSIVATSNAMRAILLHGSRNQFNSSGYLDRINQEAMVVEEHDSLLLALKTVDHLTDRLNGCQTELLTLHEAKKELHEVHVRLGRVSGAAVSGWLLVISYFVYLWVKYPKVFTSILSESLMWIPVVLGVLATVIYERIVKKLTDVLDNERSND